MNNIALGICAVLLLSGCGSKSPRNQPQDSAAAGGGETNSSEPWFCQVGASNDEWDCVRDEALVKQPRPSRLPEPRTPAPPAPQQTGQPQQAPATPPPIPVERAEQSATPPTASNLPRHVELSYRPAKPVAILDLPADFSAVQLVAVSSKEALEEYAQKHKLAGMSAARTYDGSQMFYVLLLGIYETRNNAQLAIKSLRGPLGDLQPWIRSVGSLQAAMLEADSVAGGDDY